MPSNHLILCHPLLLLPSIFPSIRVFSNELALCIRWPKYWSFSFSISPCNEYSGLISFGIYWLDLSSVHDLKVLKSYIVCYHCRKESESEVAQSCLTLSISMDCRPSGSSVHGIFQARVQEWVAISFSRRSSQPRDQTWVSRIAGQTLYHLSHQGSLIMVEINIKRYLKITHLFSSAM